MTRQEVQTPTSILRLGHGRADVTPPVGIYHRMWGAARHDRATGVHRPLLADVLVFAPSSDQPRESWFVRAELDMVGLDQTEHLALRQTIAKVTGVPQASVCVTYSHTHAGGFFAHNRRELPGGELIEAHLVRVTEAVAQAAQTAVATLQPVTISYASGHCAMAAQRDCWDDDSEIFVCGLNPDVEVDNRVIVGRVSDAAGRHRKTLVHYGCHPTTLAWDNTLISPDYVGAMRDLVELDTRTPAIFLLAPCGELGPRHGFVGDTAVADSNGRELGYAALAALASVGPAGEDFAYLGPVVSGATIGTWGFRAFGDERRAAAASFSISHDRVELPLRQLPTADEFAAELADWETQQAAAEKRGDAIAARDCGARAERCRRWLNRLETWPCADRISLDFTVLRCGDAIWVTCPGEPYAQLQSELQLRFPQHLIIASPLAGAMDVAYLLPRDQYGRGLYQEEPSMLAAGGLETLIETIAATVERVL